MADASDEVCYDKCGADDGTLVLLGVERAGLSTRLAAEPSAELAAVPSAELAAAGSVPFLARNRAWVEGYVDVASFHQVTADASDEVCSDRCGGEDGSLVLLGMERADLSIEPSAEPSSKPSAVPFLARACAGVEGYVDGASFHQVMAAASGEVCCDECGGEGCSLTLLGVNRVIDRMT